jgi:hypothetical protein
LQDTISNPEFVKFLEIKDITEDCIDVRKCVERLLTKRDIASLVFPVFATYVAREMGTVDVGRIICFLDKAEISVCVTVLFKNGNPLLERFNILMRLYLEAGLLENLWTELQHRAPLRGGDKFGEAAGDVIFSFSVSHIKPAFVVLLVGTVLSLVVFIF